MFELLLTLLTIIFVIMLISVALTFGFFLVMWFIGTAIAFWVYILLRNLWRRWMFVYRGRSLFTNTPPVKPPPQNTSDIIEAEFEDLPPKY